MESMGPELKAQHAFEKLWFSTKKGYARLDVSLFRVFSIEMSIFAILP